MSSITLRRTLSRTLIVMTIIVMSTAVSSLRSPAFGCSCGQQSDERYYEGATDVFVGEARLVRDGDPVVYEVTVESVQKGAAGAVELVAIPRYEVEDCQFELRPGRRYQIFGGARDELVYTTLCSGTRDLGHAAQFDAPEPEVPVDGGGPTPATLADPPNRSADTPDPEPPAPEARPPIGEAPPSSHPEPGGTAPATSSAEIAQPPPRSVSSRPSAIVLVVAILGSAVAVSTVASLAVLVRRRRGL